MSGIDWRTKIEQAEGRAARDARERRELGARLAAAEKRASDANARAGRLHAALVAVVDAQCDAEDVAQEALDVDAALTAPATQPDERAAAERATEDAVALFDEDNRYFDERAEQIIARFPEEWVAIYHKTVVGHDLSLDGLMDSLIRDGLPVGTVAVRRATFDPPLFLLALDITDGAAKETT